VKQEEKTMKSTESRIGAALLALAAAAAAQAQEATFPQVTFGGYGTLGLVGTDNDHADYFVDEFRPTGPGHTRRWSADPDSRLGLQLSTQFTSQLSAVLQVLSQQDYRNSYRPEVEWANVKYQATPDFSVRGGRIVLPVFMVTDTRLVGYANPWVRTPVEVYSLVPVTHNDGVDATWRLPVGEAINAFQLTLGRSDSKFPNASGFNAGTAKVRDIVAVADSIERGSATLRLSYGQARLTIDAYAPFAAAFRQFGPVGSAIADKYSLNDRRVTFAGVGASYDPGDWFAMGEWARFKTNSLLGTKSAWYLSGGYRIGKLTPYVTYARIKADTPTSDPGLPVAGLPPEAAATATFLNATLNTQLNLVPVQRTISAGLRWDFARNAALKLQYDHVGLGANSHGTFGNIQPEFQPGGSVQVYSAAVDFVF
jgi:predicted porin